MTIESGKKKGRLTRKTAIVARWLHIYLSMASFALVLFFSITGLTLNHPDWFVDRTRTDQRHGVIARALLHTHDADGADKLKVAEALREQGHLRGTVTDFRVDDTQVSVSFRGPGYTADAFIDRATGTYDLTEVQSNFVAVMNDLHKGRDTGKAWAAVIDVSAILLTLVSLTGLVLIWFVYKRRLSALVLASLAALGTWAVWALFVK